MKLGWLSSLFGKKKGKKVLIVEDDALLADILTSRLRESGIDVLVETNGLNVIDVVKREQPAMVLLDLVIPGIDGFDVLRQLKGNELTKKIKVIVISNLGQAADMKSAMALGAEEYFVKAQTELEKILSYVKEKLSS